MAHYDDPYSLSCCGMDPVAGHSPRCSTNNPGPGAHADLVERLTGRARFCRDRGEIKTPEWLEGAAAELTRLRAQLAAYKAMAEEMEPLLLYHETGGHEGDGSEEKIALIRSRYQAMKDQADG